MFPQTFNQEKKMPEYIKEKYTYALDPRSFKFYLQSKGILPETNYYLDMLKNQIEIPLD